MFRMGKTTTPERKGNQEREVNRTQEQQQQQPAPPSYTSNSSLSQTPDYQTQAPVERPQASQRAVSETDALARGIKEGNVSGFVGSGTMLNGDVTFKDMLRVDGHLSGHISSDKGTLIVSAGGQVDAGVAVGVAKINGTVNGDITATERVEFGRAAKVKGNVQTPALIIEQGAVFDGGCRMTQLEAATNRERDEEFKGTQSKPTLVARSTARKYVASDETKAQVG
ncbi:MAG TPA: polymer-forming cytoskeletal protein [Pyrinomonadaceae bacterium]|nr:polymer-forming cytoskeletal protein [Pyrinomonadaceae bacterium]